MTIGRRRYENLLTVYKETCSGGVVTGERGFERKSFNLFGKRITYYGDSWNTTVRDWTNRKTTEIKGLGK